MTRLFEKSISPTLQWAAQHPYYATRWGKLQCEEALGVKSSAECRALLVKLPPTPKEALAGELFPVPMPGDKIAIIGHTTGTTSRPNKWYCTESEKRALQRIEELRNVQANQELPKRLGLRIYPAIHGVPNSRFSPSDQTYFFDASVSDDAAYDITLSLLTEEHRIPGFAERVTEIQTTPRVLATLTEALQSRGVAPKNLAVERIATFGGYLNSHYRELYGTYWTSAMIDMYSCSEIPGGGVVCPRCGYIFFDPHFHPQVLDIACYAPKSHGVGLLALTVLLPFCSAQPLIKYLNGDIAEQISNDQACCPAHVGGIRVVGRKATSIVVEGSSEVLITSNELHDVFFHPAVAKLKTQYEGIKSLPISGLSGLPYVGFDRTVEKGTRLTIRYRPLAGNIQAGIDFRSTLLQRAPRLQRSLLENSIELMIETDDTLVDALKK